MLIYNIPSHFRGDTWNGISSVTVNSNRAPLNLAGASIKMQLREYIDSPVVLEFSTTAGSIVIVDAAQGIFSIPSTIVDIPIGVYSFDIQITQSNGVVGTYISGTWEIIADIEGAVLTGSVPPITIIVTALNYDPAGAATIAQANAQTYSNSLSSSYDPAGAAAAAQNNAEAYADSLAVNYDLAGAAATAQANAKTYSNSLSSSYDVAGAATIAQNNAKTYSNSLSSSYDVAGAATIAQNNAIAAIPPQVESANFSAVAGGRYITTATLTITDPTGVTNQSFVVIVASGTCTIGGVAYSSSNFPIIRYYNGTAWVTLPQTLTGVLTTSGFATTSPSIEIVSSHSIACAATLALSGILANDIVLTGSAVAITSITGGTLGGLYSLNNQTGGSVTLTNSASLICQTGANISLAVGASVFIRPASSTVVSTL
jgi:hypothetical protein